MIPARRLITALACVAACQSTHAARTGVSDESDVADAGDCQTELAFERTGLRDEPTQRERAVRLTCGIGWDTELEAAHKRQHSGAARGESLAFEAKIGLRDRGEQQVGWALVLGLGADRGSGSWRRSEQSVAVEATRLIGADWLVEAKLGAAHDVAPRRSSTLWAVAVEQALGERVEWRAELEGDDRRRPLAKVGLRYTLWPERVQLKLSYGARSGPQRERNTSLGLQFEF